MQVQHLLGHAGPLNAQQVKVSGLQMALFAGDQSPAVRVALGGDFLGDLPGLPGMKMYRHQARAEMPLPRHSVTPGNTKISLIHIKERIAPLN
ncbi:hypothetical protein [Paracoccus xiamenensis]|uniref:hypothetical protein n=1 Tax=Paracoccus xiamenensis TaxID=2714901 RepID=UPI001409729C|nr:hypothetical protein [Paracoccus xiamenensis]NHF72675.1 hypothetical protein [Paracoccus xiamenensis]